MEGRHELAPRSDYKCDDYVGVEKGAEKKQKRVIWAGQDDK